MNFFMGKLTRGAYAGRLFGGFFVAFGIIFGLLYAADHTMREYRLLINNGGVPVIFFALIIYWIIIAAKRLRDIGVSPWWAVVVLVLGPLGFGCIAAVASKEST